MQSLIAISQTLKCRIRKQKQIRTYNMHFNKNVKILSLKHAEKRFFFSEKVTILHKCMIEIRYANISLQKQKKIYIDRIKFKYGLLNCGQYFQKL